MGAAAAAVVLAASPAAADVPAATPTGFEIYHRATVPAPPERVWPVLFAPARWWSPAHSYSGDAANLTLEVRPGGCFCERLPAGGVEHMRVTYVEQKKQFRLVGALGPLGGDGVAGALTFTIEPTERGTEVVLRYIVGGWRPAGMERVAGAVDRVLGEQLARLAAAVR